MALGLIGALLGLGIVKARVATPKPLRPGHAQGRKCLGMALGLIGAFASALDFRYLCHLIE